MTENLILIQKNQNIFSVPSTSLIHIYTAIHAIPCCRRFEYLQTKLQERRGTYGSHIGK